MPSLFLRTLLAFCLAVTGAGAAVLATAPEAEAAGTPDIALTKEMPSESLYGDPIPVTLTATNPAGPDGYNLSFTDVLPPDVTVADATPAPDRVLPQPDGTTVLIWDNVADLLRGTTVSVTYDLVADHGVYGISSVVTNSASAYVNSDPRLAPRFTGAGEVLDGSSTGSATAVASTTLIPFSITKAEPSPEAELMRGVHDHKTVYSLTVQNNGVLASTGFSLVDHLPAGLEFLGCSAVDNTSGTDVEYPGAGRIDATAHPAFTHPCAEPTSVTTVTTDPDAGGPMPNAVYTRVEWSSASLNAALGSSGLAAGGEFTIDYAAAVPLRSNVQADLADPTANLDNNTGPLTADEQELRNVATVTGSTAGTEYSDTDILTVSAENLAIQKSVDAAKVVQGDVSSWTLNLQTSEYAVSTGTFTVTDTLPASLDLTGSTPATESVTTNGDGTQTLTWLLPAASEPSRTPQITFTTQVRATYRTVGGPIAANDRWTNRVAVSAPVELVVDGDGTTDTLTLEDESSADQYTAGVALSKEVANPVSGAMTCTDPALSFVPEVSTGPYRTGDRVCWRLTVSFPGSLDTVSPVVRDFLPPGFVFEGFDFTAANSVDEGSVAFSSDDEPALRWTLPDAAPAETFQVVVSSRITEPDAAASGDVLSNLMKLSYENSAGGQFQLRDKADAPYVEPQLTLSKSASAPTVNGGDVVTYTLDVPNSGGLRADDVSVRDLLPAGISCADVVDLGGATCTPAAGGAPAHLQWDGLTVPADGATSLEYQVRVPTSFAPGTQLRNTAGVRSYTNPTNSGEPSTLVPRDNIDPDLTPNTDPAGDGAVVRVDAAGLTKARTTGVDEAGNAAADEATVGETVTYAVEATVPGGTTLVNGVVRDALPAGLTLVGAPTYALDGAALPGTFQTGVVDDVITVTFPTPYTNTDADDVVVRIVFTARVTDVAANVRGADVRNAATFGWDGGSTNASVDTRIVEPDLSVTKRSDDTDGLVVPGQPVTYTVTVVNGNSTDVSTAHDLTVTDAVPVAVVPLDTNGDPAADGATVGDGGVWDADTRTITWQLTTLAPGDSSALSYDTLIADPLIGGASVRNTVTAVGTSLDGSVTGERTAASGYPGYQASDSVELRGPVFSVAKSASPGTATIGEPVTYTVDVTIPERVEGRDVTVLDVLPPGIAFDRLVSATCAGCSPDVTATALSTSGDTGTVGFFLGDVVSSATERVVRLTYLAYPDGTVREDAAGTSDRVTNTARLYFNATDKITGTPPAPPAAGDFDGSSDPSSATVEIDEPRLQLDKAVDGQVGDADARRATPGTTLTYTVVVRNTGSSPAYDVVVDDTPDGRLVGYADLTDTAQAGGVTPVDADPSDGSLRWTVAGPVAPGSSVTVSYRLTVPTTLDETDEVLGGPEVTNTAGVPAYFGLPEAERDQPGRTYPQYEDVAPDTVDVELDLASIGDLVWHDVNGDGIKGADEPVLPGVRVTVTYLGPDGQPGGGDDESHDVTTGVDGTYVVDHLPGGQYSVVVDPTSAPLVDQGLSPVYDLDGGTTTANGSWQGGLAGDAAKRDVDFGYRGTGRIGDTVYLDQDLSGTQDGTEPGIPGVGVTLVWAGPDGDPDTAGDNLTWTTTTDQDGHYEFPTLPAGDFRVTVDTSTFDPSYANVADPDGGDDSTSSVTLAAGGQDLDQDFGYAGTGAVGDTVYLDRDANGVQDAGEPGLSGVTVAVTLIGANGETATFTTTTDADGRYLVDNLPAGDYTVEVRTGLPAGVANTGDPDGGGDSTSALTLGAGDRDLDQDFGYRAQSVLGDRVWLDLDADGVQDVGEPGIPGVVVRAEGPNGTVFETTTGTDGRYSFVDIPNGAYTVTVLSGLPGGVSATYDAAGAPDGVSTTVLDGSDLDQDFGYRGSASLGDVVWLDRDGDGAVGAEEPGLPGVRVTSTYPGPDGDPSTTGDNITLTTTTDADGRYLFEYLPAGSYTVTVDTTTLPEGLAATHDVDGANDSTSVVELAADEARRDVDFGYRGTAAIGDTVWWDRDGDGTQDTAGAGAEPGLAGVAVSVTWAGADGDLTTTDDNETFTTTTDADGRYLVDGLPAGTYGVRVDTTTVPLGMVATYDEDGGLDSFSEVSLATGEEHRGADFGYRGSSSVGDTVYLDLDGDGSQGPAEPGVPGQRVDLTWAGPDGDLGTPDDIVLTTTTGPDGEYLFTDLPAGEVRVQVVGGVADVAENSGDPDGGTASRSDLTLGTGTTDLDQDFGYRGPNALGDTIWWDEDGNGVDDGAATEPRLPGVATRVTWFGPDGELGTDDDVVVPSPVTDADGRYRVDGLPDGSYEVRVVSGVPAGLAPSYDADGGTTDPNGVSVTELSSTDGPDIDLDQDFGYTGSARLGDQVWLDRNGDGTRDEGEPGLTGVTVTVTWAGPDGDLSTTDDNRVYTTTVDADGSWSVDRLPAGTFEVVLDGLPAGLTPTADPDGGDDSRSVVTLTPGASNLDQDFGYVGSASVGDTVWLDVDGNGVQDPGEPGVADVRVRVASPGSDGVPGTADDIVIETTTDADGHYLVEGLPSGPTTVSYLETSLPDGLAPGSDLDDGDATSALATVDPGQERLDVDFAVRGTATLTGDVWLDLDGDGSRGASERGIEGVTVTITWDGPDGPVSREVVTDAEGRWALDEIPAGHWEAVVDTATLPAGLVPTSPARDAVDVPTNGTGHLAHGFAPAGSIGDTVWNDVDRDGVQDPGERGVPGVVVELLDADGTVIDTVRTDADGTYRFEGLPPGTYTVRLDTDSFPDGLRLVAGDGTLSVDLAAGADVLTADFGLAVPPSAGGGPLAQTGAQIALAALLGSLLLGVGAVLVLATRRRRLG